MSEFSDKLSEYIVKSGSNVYQLAKEASLDRTTLQKTAKGQRLPSLDYIREICQYIKISSNQEEELVRLYKIEKLGHSTVKAWDEIQQIILDIYQLRKNEKSSWHIRFDELSLKSFNAQIVQKCDSEMDCLKAIMCVMEQELEDPDQAEIYMDVSWASKLVLCQLRQSEGNKSEKLTCHQLVNLKQKTGCWKIFRCCIRYFHMHLQHIIPMISVMLISVKTAKNRNCIYGNITLLHADI